MSLSLLSSKEIIRTLAPDQLVICNDKGLDRLID